MIEYLLTSFFLHSVFGLYLLYSPDSLNTNRATKLEISVISKTTKTVKKEENVIILTSHRKYLKLHNSGSRAKKTPEIVLKSYADLIKSIIDPVYYSKILPLIPKNNTKYGGLYLISVNEYGMIVNVKVIKSSGNSEIDQVAIDTFNQVKSLPKPPPELVEQGIEWEFKF